MQKIIYKYPLSEHPECSVMMRRNAAFLSVGMQNGTLMIWTLVDREMRHMEERKFFITRTGAPFDDTGPLLFIGTIHGPTLVWHIFERRF